MAGERGVRQVLGGARTVGQGVAAWVLHHRKGGRAAPQARGGKDQHGTGYRQHRVPSSREQARKGIGHSLSKASLLSEQRAFSSQHVAHVPAFSSCRPLTRLTPLHLRPSHLSLLPYAAFSSRAGIMSWVGFAECRRMKKGRCSFVVGFSFIFLISKKSQLWSFNMTCQLN